MQSVFEQTFTDYEYIIIDGGSTDGSRELIEKNATKLGYWISEKDDGIYNAMNKGIQQAKGELVVFLNSGDYYISESYFEYVTGKLKTEKAAVFFGRFIWDSPQHKDIAVSDHQQHWYHWNLKRSNFPHPATIYKRSLFEAIGLFDESYRILADYEWNVRALVKNKTAFQYLNIVSAYFKADGISNNSDHTARRKEEERRIHELYFTPRWIFNKNLLQYSFTRKMIAGLYNKKLNRIS